MAGLFRVFQNTARIVALESRVDGLEAAPPAIHVSFVGNATATPLVMSAATPFGDTEAGHEVFVSAYASGFTLTGAETQDQVLTYTGTETRTFEVRISAVIATAAVAALSLSMGFDVDATPVAAALTTAEIPIAGTGTQVTLVAYVELDASEAIAPYLVNNGTSDAVTILSASISIKAVD